MSWEDYGKVLDILYKKVSKYLKENKLKVDAIVPILRGGAFPGAYLSYRLNMLRILPVQYHYFFEKGKVVLKRVLDFPDEDLGLSKNSVFLMAENNYCFGNTTKAAAKDLREKFPSCKIIAASDHVDYSYQKIEEVDVLFWGRLTNECRELNEQECRKVGIENVSYLFPWESLDEEWATVQGKQPKYADLRAVKRTGKTKLTIKLD